MTNRVCIGSIASELGTQVPVTDGARSPEELQALIAFRDKEGFRFFTRVEESLMDVAIKAARQCLRKSRVREVSRIILCTQSLWDQTQFSLDNIRRLAIAIDQPLAHITCITGTFCSNVQTGINLGKALIQSGEATEVLVIAADIMRPDASRIHHVELGVSGDGAVALLMSCDKDALDTPYALLASAVLADSRFELSQDGRGTSTQDAQRSKLRFVHNLRKLVSRLGEQSGIHEHDHFIPNNYAISYLEMFCDILLIEQERLRADCLGEYSHVASCDVLLTLDYLRKRIGANEHILMISTGPNMWGGSVLSRLGA
jgi:3-oxoacyl-[acyl-carrier-protein] synthase III